MHRRDALQAGMLHAYAEEVGVDAKMTACYR
jgi:hypothetical protein